jgi:hypothetical protein
MSIYNYLLKNFGGIGFSGTRYLAYLVEHIDNKTNLQTLYKKLAEDNSTTPAAVERAVRNYLTYLLGKVTIEELSVMFDYAFEPEQNISVKEFVLVLNHAMFDGIK